MAKKKSANAVKKIDKQIDALQKKRVKNEKESIPVVDKKAIDKKLIEEAAKKTSDSKKKITNNNTKKKTTSKNTSTTKNSNTTKKNTNSKTTTTKKTTNSKATPKKEVKKKVSEETVKYNNLEKEIRSLYDRVNDITDDLDYSKTVVEADDILISDIKISKKGKITKIDEAIDNVSFSTLNKTLLTLFIVFSVLFVIFVGFVIFVSTY